MQVVDAFVDDPSEQARGEVECSRLEPVGYLGGIVACLLEDTVGCHGECGSHIGDEPESDGKGDKAYNEGLHNVALSVRQDHHKDIEHASKRG